MISRSWRCGKDLKKYQYCWTTVNRTTGRKCHPSHLRGRCGGTVTTEKERALSSSTTQLSNEPPSSPLQSCDVVQGPSLLKTTVSRPRPSLISLPGLRALPFWTRWDQSTDTRVAYQDPQISYAVNLLETNFHIILQEFLQIKANGGTTSATLQSDYGTATNDHRSLHHGKWDWYSYMQKGHVKPTFSTHFPKTSALLQTLRDEGLLFEGTPFGYAFFSVLGPHSNIASHSAPMNLRLRVHLPLQVPSTIPISEDDLPCAIRVGSQVRSWLPGKALVLDDSFEHEVWNRTSQERSLLLLDLWHPDVTQQERLDIVTMFHHAKDRGWLSSKE